MAKVKAAGAVVGLAIMGGVGVAAWMALRSRQRTLEKPGAVKPAPVDPSRNPNVNYDLPPVVNQTATGYRPITTEQVTVDLMHLDPFWQYEGV